MTIGFALLLITLAILVSYFAGANTGKTYGKRKSASVNEAKINATQWNKSNQITPEKRLTNAELKEILAKHELWLKYKYEGEGECADLKYANLAYMELNDVNLQGANLEFASLSGSDLSKSNLSVSNLHSARLFKTKLSHADLNAAYLDHADLRGVILDNANLSYAILTKANLESADLSEANLSGANLSGVKLALANLKGADLSSADLSHAQVDHADLSGADLSEVILYGVNLSFAKLSRANLDRIDARFASLDNADLSFANMNHINLHLAKLDQANLRNSSLNGANLGDARLEEADLRHASLEGANLCNANLEGADLRNANLNGADLSNANLRNANLKDAILTYANLMMASLVGTDLSNTNLEGAKIYGISVWDVKKEGIIQRDLVITKHDQPEITVDNLEVAQFIYMLLNNQNIRDVIDTLTSKTVLILGRFTEERKSLLNAIKDKLRNRNYIPILFDFEKPASRDLTETISILAKMSRFVVADLTDAKSIPHELSHIVPFTPSLPVLPIILRGQPEYVMFEHFISYPWVMPLHTYETPEILITEVVERIIEPAEQKVKELSGWTRQN